MNVTDFARGIAFADIQPDTDLATRPDWAALNDLERRNREIDNTLLPERGNELRQQLAPVMGMARMSTFAVAALINHAVAALPEGHAYVNVGVWHGFTLLAGMAGQPQQRCVGIDDFSQFGGPRQGFLERFNARRGPAHSFHDGDYRDYFRRVHMGAIGFYLYDGAHSYDHQIEGLRAAEQFFAPECYVLIDDVNWAAPRRAALDFIASSSRRYEMVLDRSTAHNKHPTFWNGLMLLRSTTQ
jgi:hypothetical protein